MFMFWWCGFGFIAKIGSGSALLITRVEVISMIFPGNRLKIRKYIV